MFYEGILLICVFIRLIVIKIRFFEVIKDINSFESELLGIMQIYI